MKLLEIALFLFNIFEFAISTEKLIPQNVEIVLRQYTDPLTGKRQEKTYEKRSNYLEEGEKYPKSDVQDLSDLESLKGIAKELKKAADDIVRPYNNRLGPIIHQDELKADDTARFSVTFTGLDVGAVHKLLAEEPNPKRISGKVKIGYNFEDRLSQLDAQLAALKGTAAAAAAKPTPKDSAAGPSPPPQPPTVEAPHESLQFVAENKEHSHGPLNWMSRRGRTTRKKDGLWHAPDPSARQSGGEVTTTQRHSYIAVKEGRHQATTTTTTGGTTVGS